jgi:hypothetical protein
MSSSFINFTVTVVVVEVEVVVVEVVVEDVEVVVVESGTVAFVAVDAISCCVVEAVVAVVTSGIADVDSPPASATVAMLCGS